MTAAMTAAVAALRSLGLVDIVPVTALYGGGWTEAQLWTARTPSNLTVFAKTVANADLDTADTLGPARHQPASPTPHPAAATHELAAEIRVYRALPDSTWHPTHLDSVIADPANVDADDPDTVSVLVLEHLDPLTFKPALTRRAQPGTITVAALRALIETIAGDTDHLDVAALHWSTYTDRHPADTWAEWAHTPPAHPDTINAARFARAAPHWAAAAADLDITGTTVAHLDLHPANTAIRSDGTAVAIDLGELGRTTRPHIYTHPALCWSPTLNLAAPGDAWTGPDTIWPVSAPIAAWRAAEAGTWCNTTRAPVGHISISARRADHANHLNVALDAGVARGLPDPR